MIFNKPFMPPPFILFFSISMIITWIVFQLFGESHALDRPNPRKHHGSTISQIGGLVFSPLLLLIGWWLGLAPSWYLIGGLFSILLGAADDVRHLPWQFKLLVQLALVCLVAYIFWDRFTHFSFYGYTLPITKPVFIVIFTIWFVGIYNSVNLVDGMDGLAGGVMVLMFLGVSIIGNDIFSFINLLIAVLLLGFLLFNQRPAKVFMGDAGSLSLGFYMAVLPLLYYDLNWPTSSVLNMTPFVILFSYLIADTSRVFFTRLLSRKNPMTADTIHLHHLVIQTSGSYLTTLFMIFFVTLVSTLFAVLSDSLIFKQTGMLIYLALLFLFILTPPAPTYVHLISRLVGPLYTWNKESRETHRAQWPRTIMVASLLFLLMGSIFLHIDYGNMIPWQILLSLILLSFFLYINQKDKMVIPAIQIFFALFILEFYWSVTPDIFSKLFVVLLLVTLNIFTVQRIIGTGINQYSALDLLMLFITLGALGLSVAGIILNPWLFLTVSVIWFSLGFIFRRTVYLAPHD